MILLPLIPSYGLPSASILTTNVKFVFGKIVTLAFVWADLGEVTSHLPHAPESTLLPWVDLTVNISSENSKALLPWAILVTSISSANLTSSTTLTVNS